MKYLRDNDFSPSITLKFLTFWLGYELSLQQETTELLSTFDDTSGENLIFRCWSLSFQGEHEIVNDYVQDLLAISANLFEEITPTSVQLIIQLHEIIISAKFSLNHFEEARDFIEKEKTVIEKALTLVEFKDAWEYWRWYPRLHELRYVLLTKSAWEAKNLFESWEEDASRLDFSLVKVFLFNTVGTIFMLLNELLQAASWFQKAIDVGKETGFLRSAVPAMSNLADIKFLLGNVLEAVQMGKEALKGFRDVHSRFNEFLQLMSLVEFTLSLNDRLTAARYWREALNLYQQENNLKIPLFKAFLHARYLELELDDLFPVDIAREIRQILKNGDLSSFDPQTKLALMECQVLSEVRESNFGNALRELDKIITTCFEHGFHAQAWQFTLKRMDLLIKLSLLHSSTLARKKLLLQALDVLQDLFLYGDLDQRPLIRVRLIMTKLLLQALLNEPMDKLLAIYEEFIQLIEAIKKDCSEETAKVLQELERYSHWSLEGVVGELGGFPLVQNTATVDLDGDVHEFFLLKALQSLILQLSRIPVAHLSTEGRHPQIRAILIQSSHGLNYFSRVHDDHIDPDLLSGLIAALQSMSSSFVGSVGMLSSIKHERFVIDFVPVVKGKSFLTVFLNQDDPLVRHQLRQLAKDLSADPRIMEYLSLDFVKRDQQIIAIIEEKIKDHLGNYLSSSENEKI